MVLLARYMAKKNTPRILYFYLAVLRGKRGGVRAAGLGTRGSVAPASRACDDGASACTRRTPKKQDW
ncbi:hypothetical protein B5X24_HaOG207759 [Helicoverpa armigera]|nr:hypothetical protein B5X24_HaOG207759 [Helicoverpa armigera]